MGTIVKYPMTARRRMLVRSRLLKIFKQQYLAEGYPEEVATSKAMAKVRERTEGADET